MGRFRFIVVLVAAALAAAAYSDYTSAQQKIDQIESGKLRAGTRIVLTPRELTAWAAHEAPAGVRNPLVQLGTGTATGSALIDFGKIRRAQGYNPGWLMSKLLDGERPVRVVTRIQSSKGQATVDVESVEVSGLKVDGQVLDFMIQNFLMAMYPDAAVGRPFEIGARVDRIEVTPAGAGVIIGR